MPEVNNKYLNEVSKKGIHKYYERTVDHAIDMGVHVEGETPEKLLKINRPNEQENIREYRLSSYQPVTQSLSEKVVNTVNKIFNPKIWSMSFPEMNTDNSLESYLNKDYPFYRSIMNFIAETFTTKDFSDPNGAIVVMPRNFEIEETQLFEPVAYVYDSKSIHDFKENEYYTFVFDDVVKIFTTSTITYYKRVDSDKWQIFFEYMHNFGVVPVFRMGGIPKGKKEPYYFESWIRGVLPHWNQVVNLTSDLQAAYVNHLYMDKWEFETECNTNGCNSGWIKTEIQNGKDTIFEDVKCNNCKGTGKVSSNPYGIHTVNRDAITSDINPIPPAGYIDKPIDIVDKVEDRIAKEEKRGFASINMEIVQMVGNDQSGAAKTVDREDLNAFLSRYSRHVFEYVLPNLIYNIALWRYGVVTAKVSTILPTIKQPKDFNVLTLNQLATEYKDASNSNVSSSYLNHLEGEITDAKFSNNEDARRKNKLIIVLNPYPGKSTDDLLTMGNLGAESWRIHVSFNLNRLVDMAIEDDPSFLDKELKEQREVINAMAKVETGYVKDAQRIEPMVE